MRLSTFVSIYLMAISFHAHATMPAADYLKDKIYENDPRYSTMKHALELMNERKPKTLVETGTFRYAPYGRMGYEGDGGSTDIFGTWAKDNGSVYYSVDINPVSITNAFTAVGNNENIFLVCHDSISFLSRFNQPIDFLYLDSFDYELFNPTPSQQHHLKEIKAAYPFLHSNSVVMVDDCDLPNGGKCALVIPYLLERGWRIVSQGYQVILVQN